MATVNFARREILCKIVYYGPGLCGKTTNLIAIHAKVPENLRGNLTSVATKQDRTLFFDLLPIDLGKVKDFAIRMQLYTVPGQVYYNASRKIVLKGVDGVVFVADSQQGKMDENIESFQNLKDNLKEIGADPGSIATVLQYNKRDLPPVYTIEELNEGLNPNNLSYFEAIATTGQGVFNTLKKISELVVDDIKEKLESAGAAVTAPRPAAPQPAPVAPQAPPAGSVPQTGPTPTPIPAAPQPPPAAAQAPQAAPKREQPAQPKPEPDAPADQKKFWGKVSNMFKRTGKG